MQSSVSEGGIPQKAVDGSTSTFFDDSTCTLTDVERAPWWYVNLLEPYMVQLVRIDFGQSCCGKFTSSNYFKFLGVCNLAANKIYFKYLLLYYNFIVFFSQGSRGYNTCTCGE